MRLIQLTIGSSEKHETHQFKNLKNITIDFDQKNWVTVLIGWNGTGKSNVLEALAIIFRDLIYPKKTPYEFAYKLIYTMGTGDSLRYIFVDVDPERTKDPLRVSVGQKRSDGQEQLSFHLKTDGDDKDATFPGKPVKLSEFLSEDAGYLPRYIFSYYSGESTRMHELFRPYLERYDSKLRNGEDPGMKRLFYAMPVHSQFVLLAFLTQPSDEIRNFLDSHLGLDPEEGIESVLFVLKQPPWNSKAKDGDPRFWNARGVVSEFLGRLQDIALAPIENSRRVKTSLWNEKNLQFKYLYIKDITKLRELVKGQSSAEFFRDLESTYVSQLIDEVRIRVRLKKNDGSVTFRELSEGEQQLLTVLGLLRFTAEDESLFLLDEPDTHLNPRWCVDYISYLKKFIANDVLRDESSHILLTTHNPLAIAELEKEQVQILQLIQTEEQRTITVCNPEVSPKGMGYAAIVTSDMFGIASSLDEPTQLLLEKQRNYAAQEKLTSEELKELDRINADLDRLGFRFFHPDDEYSRYLRLRNKLLSSRFDTHQANILAAKTLRMSRQEREDLSKQLIADLLKDLSIDSEGGMN